MEGNSFEDVEINYETWERRGWSSRSRCSFRGEKDVYKKPERSDSKKQKNDCLRALKMAVLVAGTSR
jgi:hypothetical protein